MLENNSKKIVTRFAPSPTGFLHVGGARTALYAWAFARKNNGTFILRIEDTDKEREVAGSIDHIIKSLKWLGLDWNEGPDIGGPNAPYKQSERLDSYRKYAQILVDKGLAYADPYTSEQLDEFRKKSESEHKLFLYRDYRPENPPKWDGTQALRLKVEPKTSNWTDAVRGDLSAGPEALDDFILIKSDGYPTYNFAHIIDDLHMGTTHIFRADEFISSTPKFLALYEALEIERPIFVTLPPIMGPDGKKKLSKRDGAKDLLDYSKEGFLPNAVLNFLAFIGWNPGGDIEVMSPTEIVSVFEIEKIHKSGGGFNEEKLLWFNKEHLKRLPISEISEKIKPFIEKIDNFDENIYDKILPIIIERISKFSDVETMIADGEIDYYFNVPEYDVAKIIWKDSDKNSTKENLIGIKNILEKNNSNYENPEFVKNLIWSFAEEKGRGQVLWPLRFALSGREKSPDPFTLIYILGKDESIKRINNALEKLN